jgi:hypothetical protein
MAAFPEDEEQKKGPWEVLSSAASAWCCGAVTCFTFFGQSECLFWTARGELSDVEKEV